MANPTSPEVDAVLETMAREGAYPGSPAYNEIVALLRRAYDLGIEAANAELRRVHEEIKTGGRAHGELASVIKTAKERGLI